MKRFIGVDPGINNPALTVIGQDKELLHSIKFHAKPAHSIPEKLHESILHFVSFMSTLYTPQIEFHVAIELPEHQDSIRGQKCIDRNDFVKLCMSAGALANLFQGMDWIKKVHLFSPSQWKGQVPKRVTRKRMEDVYGLAPIAELSDDQVDALALARYLSDSYET